MRSARVRPWVCAGATLTFSIAGPLIWDGRIASLRQPAQAQAQAQATGVVRTERPFALLELRGLVERLDSGDYALRHRVAVTFRDNAAPDRPRNSGTVDFRLPVPMVVVNP